MTPQRSILIVDDEAGVRESLKMILKSSYDIHTASDGEEALKIIKEQKIDLITLDLNMPKLSGIQTLREIRKIKDGVPVIIITGYGTQKDEKEALLYGARDFISKPFNIGKITSAISGILEEHFESKEGNTERRPVKFENS